MVKWNYRGCQGHLTSLHRTIKLTYSQIGFYSLAVFILNLLSVYSLSLAFYFWKLFLCFKIYQFVWFLQLFFSTNENYLECVRITLECVGHTQVICNNPKLNGKILFAFCWGTQGDANIWFGQQKYIFLAAFYSHIQHYLECCIRKKTELGDTGQPKEKSS